MRKTQIDARFPYVREFINKNYPYPERVIVKAPVPFELSFVEDSDAMFRIDYPLGTGFCESKTMDGFLIGHAKDSEGVELKIMSDNSEVLNELSQNANNDSKSNHVTLAADGIIGPHTDGEGSFVEIELYIAPYCSTLLDI